MTEKQEKILATALELFANDGFNATPTSKIARAAGVSEGLIFKHFGNKNGLLDAIMKEAESRLEKILMPIMIETDPKSVIRKTIMLPFSVKHDQYDFWKLQFKLKWESDYQMHNKMQPLIDKLASAFSQLNFERPEEEARLLNQIVESISTEILRDNRESQEKLRELLLAKYKL